MSLRFLIPTLNFTYHCLALRFKRIGSFHVVGKMACILYLLSPDKKILEENENFAAATYQFLLMTYLINLMSHVLISKQKAMTKGMELCDGSNRSSMSIWLMVFVLINWLNICFLDISFDAQILTDLFSGGPGIYLLVYFDKFLHPLSAYFLSPSTRWSKLILHIPSTCQPLL